MLYTKEHGSTVERILDDLKIATGWQNITVEDSAFTLHFDLFDRHKIRGLSTWTGAHGHFYLDFEQFDEVPIALHIRDGKNSWQYWTLQRRLHRLGGRPARIVYQDDGNQDPHPDSKAWHGYRREWFWNGLLHRANGPAKEVGYGFTTELVDEDGFSTHYDRADTIAYEWFTEGTERSHLHPHDAKLEKVFQAHRDEEKTSTLRAAGATFHWQFWDNPDYLTPQTMFLGNLEEMWKDGKVILRSCSTITTTFKKKDGSTFQSDKLDNLIKDEYLQKLNLWHGPFYDDPEFEFHILAEVS